MEHDAELIVATRRLDGRTPPPDAFLVVNGRRWRRSDPAIPDALRQELVNELMSARRAVGAARHERDERAARLRVHDAKVALGERGRRWWEPWSPEDLEPRIDAAMRALLHARRDGATICPSEAARIAGGASWRRLLPFVRARAVVLAEAGHLVIQRRGVPVTVDPTAGVLRYGRCSTSRAPVDQQPAPNAD